MLKGKSAIVTGSTSGIGLGIARALGGAGANLMLNGFGDAAQIEALRAGLAKEFGVKVAYNGADMSKPEQIHAMVKAAAEALGAVDILVNNAGIQHTAPVESFPHDRWDAVIAINLSSVFHATQAALSGMKARNWGNAIAAYERIMSVTDGRNPLVLNNLAYAQDQVGNKQVALGYALRALKEAPQNPSVMDTAAWLLIQTGGDRARALQLLRAASDKAPQNATIRAHLQAAQRS